MLAKELCVAHVRFTVQRHTLSLSIIHVRLPLKLGFHQWQMQWRLGRVGEKPFIVEEGFLLRLCSRMQEVLVISGGFNILLLCSMRIL